jgi:DNA-binding CsgD family transcriptional regulator
LVDRIVMTAVLRNSGIPLLNEVPWGSHLCLFYETEDDLFESVASYLEAGLQANELCIWLLPVGFEKDPAQRKLAAHIDDFDRYLDERRIELIPVPQENVFDEAKLERLWADSLARALTEGFEGLRAAGDGSALPEDEPQLHYERAMHVLLSDKPALALCTYSLTAARAIDVFDVVRRHNLTVARRSGEWQFMETPELERANERIRNLDDALAILSTPFPGHELLTERERMVLAFLVKGASSKEAARDLGISPRTVDFHRANIIEKLGARNTADAIRRVLSRH